MLVVYYFFMSNKFFDLSLQIYFFKKFNISILLTVDFFFFNNLKFLLVNNLFNKQFYFMIPLNLKIIKINNFLFFSKIEIKSFNNTTFKYEKFFFFNFFKKLFCLQNLESKSIFIKGVGFRINFLEDSKNILKLKLGYSHFIYLKYSNELLISLFKKKIIIRSFNNILLGNFCMLLKNFRPLNVFTGKGLRIKRNKFKLKQYIKKI